VQENLTGQDKMEGGEGFEHVWTMYFNKKKQSLSYNKSQMIHS
jgi:hypothetical protein